MVDEVEESLFCDPWGGEAQNFKAKESVIVAKIGACYVGKAWERSLKEKLGGVGLSVMGIDRDAYHYARRYEEEFCCGIVACTKKIGS